jgi:hypothetical protein
MTKEEFKEKYNGYRNLTDMFNDDFVLECIHDVVIDIMKRRLNEYNNGINGYSSDTEIDKGDYPNNISYSFQEIIVYFITSIAATLYEPVDENDESKGYHRQFAQILIDCANDYHKEDGEDDYYPSENEISTDGMDDVVETCLFDTDIFNDDALLPVDVMWTRSPNIESVVFIQRDSEDTAVITLTKNIDDNIEFQIGIGARVLSLIFSDDGREIRLN